MHDMWQDFERLGKIGEYRFLAKGEENVVIRVENESGEGDMIVHEIFPGVYLMYNDFHMAYFDSTYQNANTTFAIDYCREGCLTLECDNGLYQVKNAGSICIDSRVHHKGKCVFPTSHFHGITIGFEEGIADASLRSAAPGIETDLEAIRCKFCSGDDFYIIKTEETLNRIFTDLYRVPNQTRLNYFRTKVIELLVCLSVMEKQADGSKVYFYKDQIEKTKAVEKLITKDLTKHYTIEELSDRFDISQTALKSCFKETYGSPINTWLRDYRMSKAQELLIDNTELSIGDIAYQVGYESAGKFAAIFKKKCGMTPREYRQQPY